MRRLHRFQPDLVGFTAYTNEIKPAAYQASLVKKSMPHVITVIGGVHLTALPAETLREFPTFDVGVVGEGEITFYELCNAIKQGNDIHNISGLVYHLADGNVTLTAPRPRILDQDSIPLPAWDLLPPAESYFVQSLRGCPFNCVFCMNPQRQGCPKTQR